VTVIRVFREIRGLTGRLIGAIREIRGLTRRQSAASVTSPARRDGDPRVPRDPRPDGTLDRCYPRDPRLDARAIRGVRDIRGLYVTAIRVVRDIRGLTRRQSAAFATSAA
jgi:hypothetical protein